MHAVVHYFSTHTIVTLARALELHHKPSVVFALAAETANLFNLAGNYQDTLRRDSRILYFMTYI